MPDELNADDERLLRKAHWAIDKVTNDMGGRFNFNTAIAAVMELVNEVTPAKRGEAAPGAVRFALATAASLLSPFAPHVSADAYHRLTGERVWEQPWPAADPACLEPTRSSSSARSTARSATACRRRRARREDELLALAPRGAERCRRTSTATTSSRRSSCPDKLVNIVVR